MASMRPLDGERHNILNKLIGHFIGLGADPIMVRDMLLGWNRGMCEPPISDKEIVSAVTNIAGRELAKHTWLR